MNRTEWPRCSDARASARASKRALQIAAVAALSLAMASVATAQAELGDPARGALDAPGGEPEFDDAAQALSPAAREEGAAFGGAARFLGEGETWILDDAVGVEALPWDPYDRENGYVPRGAVHAGVQLRVAAVLGGGLNVPDGALFELSGFLDIRYRATSPWRLRLGIAASFQSWHEQYLGAGTLVSSSPFSLRLRALFLNVDLGRWINLRLGGDIGMQWSPSGGGGRVDVAGGPIAEITLLLLDGALEVGVAVGMPLTAYNRTGREHTSVGYAPGALLGVTAAYVIP